MHPEGYAEALRTEYAATKDTDPDRAKLVLDELSKVDPDSAKELAPKRGAASK